MAETTVANARELDARHHFQLYKRYPVTLVRGEGARVWDDQGKEYIDALAGIAVNGVGHCHPKVVQAIRDQAGTLIHCSNLYTNEPQARLAKLITGASGMDRVFFTNSGTEAVEGALKLARRYAGKKDRKGPIVSMDGCFHGRSMGALSTHSEKQKAPFEPLLPGFTRVPFADPDALEKELKAGAIAVIFEPVQGEGGLRAVSDEFLRQARKLCDDHGALLILDEIQCGVGRTGKFFAYQHAGITPDIVTSAKALGGGVPVGAVLARDEVAQAFEFGDHGTTYGGNPLVCAAAEAAVSVIVDEKLADRAATLGERMRERISEARKERPSIKGLRGRGLMVGVELDFEGKALVVDMLERGVLANCTADTIIRFLPPLTISEGDLDKVVDVFLAALDEAALARESASTVG